MEQENKYMSLSVSLLSQCTSRQTANRAAARLRRHAQWALN